MKKLRTGRSGNVCVCVKRESFIEYLKTPRIDDIKKSRGDGQKDNAKPNTIRQLTVG